jgi:hypothetical protein
MSLEAFIDIRFGDPVISLSLNSTGLVYGTAMGRLLFFHFSSHTEQVISELSEELISGVYLSPENTLFACIGDLKGLSISNLSTNRSRTSIVNFEKYHTTFSCQQSQAKLFEDIIIIATTEPNTITEELTGAMLPLYVIDLSTHGQRTIEGLSFPPHSVLFDFDGERLLWLEYAKNERVLHIYTLDENDIIVKKIQRKFGKVGFCKIVDDGIMLVHNDKTIQVIAENGKEMREIGRHDKTIVALGYFCIEKEKRVRKMRVDGEDMMENTDIDCKRLMGLERNKFVISVDEGGRIRVWENSRLVEEILIKKMKRLNRRYREIQYFSMGYPYLVSAFEHWIAVSTDIGVLVFKSNVLMAKAANINK